eukprot:1240526-Amphidinium_carterae.1
MLLLDATFDAGDLAIPPHVPLHASFRSCPYQLLQVIPCPRALDCANPAQVRCSAAFTGPPHDQWQQWAQET